MRRDNPGLIMKSGAMSPPMGYEASTQMGKENMMRNSKLRLATTISAITLSICAAAPAVAAPALTAHSYPLVGNAATCDLSWKWQTTTTVNLRNAPTLRGSIKGTVPSGACLVASDTGTDSRGVMWIYTSYRGKSGWISTMNLR
jgi:hypothetical protein